MFPATCALFLFVADPLVLASDPSFDTDAVHDGGWLGLDRELELLRGSAAVGPEGFSGWLRARLDHSDDSNVTGAVTVDGVFRTPRISAGFAVFDLDDDLPDGNTNPGVIWGTYALNESWDIGACGEDKDDALDSQQFVAAANWFPDGGATKRGSYGLRWTLQYLCFDNDLVDFTEFSLGLTVGF